VTGTLLVSHRRHAFSDRRPARRSSAACIQWPAPCSSVIASMHSVTASLSAVTADRHAVTAWSPAVIAVARQGNRSRIW